jgi:PAS domain S-box-containing protein
MTKHLTIDRVGIAAPTATTAAGAGPAPAHAPAEAPAANGAPAAVTGPAGVDTAAAGPAGPAGLADQPPLEAPGRRVLAFLAALSTVASWSVAGLAAGVLLAGWLLGVSLGVGPLAVVQFGVSLRFLADTTSPRLRGLGLLCAGLVLLLSLLTLAEHVFGVDLGVDRLLFPTAVTAAGAGSQPGRIAADGTLGLALLAVAHLALRGGGRRALLASQACAVGALGLAITIVYSWIYRATFPHPAIDEVRGLSLASGLALTVLAFGTIAACPGCGLTRVLTSDSLSAVIGRRLLAATATVPFVLGWLPVLAQQNALYGARFGVAVLITGNALAFGAVSFITTRAASRLEAAGAQAQQAARQLHTDLMALIDNTSAVIYMRDLEGRYRLINREYERLFDVRRENILGKRDHDLFPAEVADSFRANDLAAVERGFPIQMEETAPGDDGPHNYITVKFPLIDGAGRPYAVCGISTDITDRTRAEAEVRRLNAELEGRVRERTAELEASTLELDAFAYSVSHDLRAPLRSLDGFSQVLLDDYGDVLDDTGKDYLGRLQANAGRMAQMIDDLLDLSRASRVELSRRDVDLAEIARSVVAELREGDPDRADTTTVIIADGLHGAGDPHLLRLVLMNLIGNAWKFTAKRAAATVEVGASDSDGERVYFVRDNGAGFNMEYAGKLFEPFQRLHTRGDFDGSGLGLAIVQRILRRHGGRIWASGEPDHGAVFYFTLLPPPEDDA